MAGSSNSDVSCGGESVLVTPYQKQILLKSDLQPLNIDLSPSSDDDNSFVAESPLSSWYSESEVDIPSVINYHGVPKGPLEGINLEENYADMEEQNQFVGVENVDDSLLWEMDNRSYDELLKKFMEKEEELRVTNLKLQLSEEENIKLKVRVVNSEGLLDKLCEELKLKEKELHKQKELSEEDILKLKIQIEKSVNQLDNVSEELKLKEKELNKEKELLNEEIFKLKIQIENQLDNVSKESKMKEKEMNKQKKLLEEEIFKLKSQIDRREYQLDNVQEELNLKEEELQKQTAELDTRIPEYVYKITNLVEQLEIANEKLRISKDEIESLRNELGSKSHELDSRGKQIHDLGNLVGMQKKELKKMKSEMLNWQANFSSEKDELHLNIANLSSRKILLTCKLEECESRNKELENKLMRYEVVKRKLDMITIERDEANFKIDKLKAEIGSRELKTSYMQLVVKYETTLNEVNKLKLRVGKLENEVTRQNDVILDMAENKKEAIRQLCYSLEHYRSGYHELLQEFMIDMGRGWGVLEAS